MLHHCDDGLVLLLVRGVQVNGLRPHLVLLAGTDKLGDHQVVVVGSDVVHKALRRVLGVEDTELCVNTVVGSLEGHTLFEQAHKFLLISELLVELENVLKVVGLDNHVLSAECSHTELFGSNTSEANSFPNLRNISFLSSIEGSLVLFQLNVSLSQLLVVANTLEQNLSSKEKFVFKATITTLLSVSLVGLRDKCFEVGQESLTIFGVGENELRVNTLILN